MVRKKTPTGSALAYSYIRWSRPEQANGDSLRRQIEVTEEWCGRNGVQLDKSLSFKDAGVSAFHGGNREDPDRHALALFLQMVKDGRVRPDSYIVIENLDRLSRENVRTAVKLFLDLLDCRINIVTTTPERVFKHDTQDMTDIIIAVVELSRGNSESKLKSERCGRAWADLKRKAAADKKPITHIVPAWVKVDDGAFRLVPEKADAVRRIYALAREGFGISAIVKKLNRDAVPPISEGKRRGKHWSVSYVALILKTRATVGEYHPHRGKPVRGNPKARTPDGDPIPGFFPAVLTEDEWHATRAAVESRRKAVGRRASTVNVFLNLLTDARTGTPMHLMSHRGRTKTNPGGGMPVVCPSDFKLGKSAFCSFPLPVLEAAVFGELREVDPRAILPANRAGDEVMTLSGRLSELDQRMGVIKSRLAGDAADCEPLIDVLRSMDADRRDVANRLAEARQRAASPLTEAWGETRSLLDALNASKDKDAARTRLRAALRRITSDIRILIARKDGIVIAAVQMWFTGTDRQRLFLILFRAQRKGFANAERPALMSVLSNAWAPTPEESIDLRDSKTVKALERFIMRKGRDWSAAFAGDGGDPVPTT